MDGRHLHLQERDGRWEEMICLSSIWPLHSQFDISHYISLYNMLLNHDIKTEVLNAFIDSRFTLCLLYDIRVCCVDVMCHDVMCHAASVRRGSRIGCDPQRG